MAITAMYVPRSRHQGRIRRIPDRPGSVNAQRVERHPGQQLAHRSSGSSRLCGVELISPNAACAIARARSAPLCQPGVHLAQPPAHTSTYSRCRVRTARGGVGERLPVAVLDDDEGAVPEREVDVPVHQRMDRRRGVRGGRDALPADLEQLLADRTSISASIASLDTKCL